MSVPTEPPGRGGGASFAASLALALGLSLALALAWAPPAAAHATLVSSSPAQGARLDSLPDEVSFEFNRDMSAPAYVIVTAPDGSSVAVGDPEVDGAVVRQAVGDGPDGGYTMAYRAVSSDGHQVSGQVAFVVGDGAAAAAPGATRSEADAPGEEADGDSAAASAASTGLSRRDVVAVGVGAGLFGAALLLLLLARRADPEPAAGPNAGPDAGPKTGEG